MFLLLQMVPLLQNVFNHYQKRVIFVQFILWQCQDTQISLPCFIPQLVKSLFFDTREA